MSQHLATIPSGSSAGSDTPELREHDVVCEKGRGDHERWPGNKLYRSLITEFKDRYNDLTPVERSGIIGSISSTIRGKNGWFVQRDEATGKWGELTEEKVRKKVSDDLRREIRRRREKRSNNSLFSAKLKALKDMDEEINETNRDILQPVNDPRPSDVLFGPGARRHPGNKIYWKLMKMNLDQYAISPYGTRSVISRSIVHTVREKNGRFLEQDPKTAIWYEISDKRAIDKTSHALSNKKYKTRKRSPDDDDYSPVSGPCKPGDEASDCSFEKESEPSLESSSSQSLAKSLSKKHKLLQRMDGPEFDDDDKESIPHAANILVMGLGCFNKKPPLAAIPPTSPLPAPVKQEGGMIVTPSDNRSTVSDLSKDDLSKDDYTEYESRIPERVPSVPEAGVPHEGPRYHHYHPAAGLGPRLGHYDSYPEVQHTELAGYKKVPYVERLHTNYTTTPVRNYIEPVSAPPSVTAEYPPPPSSSRRTTHHLVHSPSFTPERPVLHSRGAVSGGYWVRDWASPAPPRPGRTSDEYARWR